MQGYWGDMESNAGEAPNGAALAAAEKKLELAPADPEREIRKRLINLDVNPGGDL
jgi:hypothetical protein